MPERDYFSQLRHEMLAGLFSSRAEFERRFVELEHAWWPDSNWGGTRLTRSRLIKFMEHCFEYSRSPYHGRYQTGLKLLRMLFPWAPGLVDLMRKTGAHAVANMLLGEGKTRFRIPDRFSLGVFLDDWRQLGLGELAPDDVYQALVSKQRIQKRIADGDAPTLALLRALFPEMAESEWTADRVRIADGADESAAYVDLTIDEDADDGQSVLLQITECNKLSRNYRHVSRAAQTRYGRNQKLAALLKRLHHDSCQWCGVAIQTARGTGYCEVHHVVGLAQGGADTSENMVVLCPNHHVVMHHCLVETPYVEGGQWHVTSTLGSQALVANVPATSPGSPID